MPRKVDGCHIHIPKHGALSAVDTRVTNFPAGGVFESARGHQRFVEPGTTTVPGSSGSYHVKNEAPAAGGASGRL